MSDEAIEKEIQAKGKTAPRVTPAALQAVIASAHYFTAANGVSGAKLDAGGVDVVDGKMVVSMPSALRLLTFCVLVLRNGFTVTGESACASPENFDAEIGQTIARQNAEQKIWLLEGYLLKQRLYDDAKPSSTGPGSTVPPHQQRVMAERHDLDDKLSKLAAFINTAQFSTLPGAEQARMRTQAVAMRTYSEILAERIAAF